MAKFLTSYDYAQGGIWLYIEADSPTQVTETYRDLTVYKVPQPLVDRQYGRGSAISTWRHILESLAFQSQTLVAAAKLKPKRYRIAP